MLAAFLINLASEMWGKKWRSSIIWVLQNGPLRFSQIKKQLPGISVKVLTECLKDLEDHSLIIRTQYNSIPVKVTYHLDIGTVPLIDAQKAYVKSLMIYFYTHKERYDLPSWVVTSLEKEQLNPPQ